MDLRDQGNMGNDRTYYPILCQPGLCAPDSAMLRPSQDGEARGRSWRRPALSEWRAAGFLLVIFLLGCLSFPNSGAHAVGEAWWPASALILAGGYAHRSGGSRKQAARRDTH